MARVQFNPAEYATELLEQQITPLDPVEWCRRKTGSELWSKQREIAMSVVNNKRTAVKSGHGVGKSFVASMLAAWWVDTHPVDETMVISTAPSGRQVHAIMWEEIRKIHAKADLPGDVQLSDNWLIGKILVGFGRKPQDYDKHAFQGLHRKYVLIIIDEACGIDEWLWIAALSIATGTYCRIVAIGNPDDPSSYFAKVCRPGSGWNVIQISVLDSPNFTDEEVSQDAKDKLTSAEWVEDMEREIGRDTPTWTSKVLGEFPEIDEFSVIPLGWIYRAQERWQERTTAGDTIRSGTRHIVGADIARFGGDRTAFAHRYGDYFDRVGLVPKHDTEKTADLLMTEMEEGSNDTAVVDTNGVGAGVYDKVRRRGKKVISFNSANRTSMKDTTGQIEFYNLRAAATWRLREALDPSRNATLCLPPDESLAADLSSARWRNMAGGKIVVEAKYDIKKRIGRSPDRGDAVILAWWITSDVVLDFEDSSFPWVESDPQDEDLEFGAVRWDESEDEWRQIAIP